MLRHVPNALTSLRLALGLAFPLCPPESRLAIVVVALATEYFDGALSRWLKITSRMGALLDPIADKVFVLSVAGVMFTETSMTWWQLLLLGARDVTVFAGSLVVAAQKNWSAFMRVRPRMSGKIATTFQFFVLVYFAFAAYVPQWLLALTWVSSCIAAAEYLYLFVRNDFYRT